MIVMPYSRACAYWAMQVRQLVKTVLPFHAMGFKNHRAVPVSAAPGLKVLEGCARVLLQTINLEGYNLGLQVRVEVNALATCPR